MTLNREITIINQDSGYLMIDLANAYHQSGFRVRLVTGRLVERNIPLNSEIEIVKIMKYDKSTTFHRMLSWVIASFQIAIIVAFRFRKSHFIFVSNPPIATFVNVLIRRKFTALVYDVYPDALEEIGYANRNSLFYKIWSSFNRVVYTKAERIITLSESMAETISQYTSKPIEVIPIWTDNTYLKPIKKEDNLFIKTHGLSNKFVVMYSGNLGETANAEVLVRFAELLKGNKNIVFVIAGEGSQKRNIAKQIEQLSLQNCILLPWQDAEMLPFSLASANLALVSLSNSAGRIALPSKLYSLLSVGVPILGICNKGTELERLITENKIGKCFRFGMDDEIIDFIQTLSDDLSMQSEFHFNVIKTSKMYDVSNVSKIIV
jgi:glycosyltransferase involved in cell wall biosynthesis